MTEHAAEQSIQKIVPFIPLGSTAKYIEGGRSNVYIFDEEGLVVKTPRYPITTGDAILREALVVAELQNPHKAPLKLPTVEDCATEAPFYAMLKKIEGTTLTPQDVKEFSPQERYRLGQKIGMFVAWMSLAMPADIYQSIAAVTNSYTPPNRSSILSQEKCAVAFNPRVDDMIGHLIYELQDMHDSLQASGNLNPTIIGHNDLRPANITFQKTSQWFPYGVIDFGNTQPSTPECELRFMAILGEDVGEAALQAYEKVTGRLVQRRLLAFWALVQVVPICAQTEALGQPDRSSEIYKQLNYTVSAYAEIAGLDTRAW